MWKLEGLRWNISSLIKCYQKMSRPWQEMKMISFIITRNYKYVLPVLSCFGIQSFIYIHIVWWALFYVPLFCINITCPVCDAMSCPWWNIAIFYLYVLTVCLLSDTGKLLHIWHEKWYNVLTIFSNILHSYCLLLQGRHFWSTSGAIYCKNKQKMAIYILNKGYKSTACSYFNCKKQF